MKNKINFKRIRLYVLENRYAVISFLVLAFILCMFFFAFYSLNSGYVYELNHGNYEGIVHITDRLFYTYFNIILYTAIYVVCAVFFCGKQLNGIADQRLILILWYLVLFLFSKVNDINVNATAFQGFIAMVSDSLYELSTIPLLLYIVLKMKEHGRYTQVVLLVECLTSLLYVIGYTVSPDSVFSVFKNISCSSVFIVTVLVIHTFSVIEVKRKNDELKRYLLTELFVAVFYFVVCIFALLVHNDFSEILKKSIYDAVADFNILPLRKTVLQDIIAISVFLDYCSIAFKQYISYVERNKSIETELKLSEGYNEIAQVRIKEVRKLKHDIKEHINVAYMYCEGGEYEKLKNYLEVLGADTASLPSLAYCNNVPSNHILVYYSEKAKNSGIRFEAGVSAGENIGLSDSEATSLLSNLLKNAYEACVAYLNSGRQDAYIKFSMHVKNSKIYVSCENSSLPEVFKDKKGRFKTTKQNTVEHGLGIAIVESICESHNGAAVFELVGEKFTVNATIPVVLE